MRNALMVFLLGLALTIAYGHGWVTRKRQGGDFDGYHDVGDFIAPILTVGGALIMLSAVIYAVLNG